jgi:hypothetical protein
MSDVPPTVFEQDFRLAAWLAAPDGDLSPGAGWRPMS